GDLAFFKEMNHLGAGKWGIRPHQQRKSEPTGVRTCRRFGQNKEFLQVLQPGPQAREVALAGGNEFRQFLKLRYADRGWQIRCFEVVPDMRVDVFVIVTVRQLAEIPIKALAARVGLSRIAPAVASPVAE